jgi:2-polyprenyl-3-methyl-5-hydroxy-6-metoxy-1,4-benzoquinol methylase
MASHVCPYWVGWWLASPIRRLVQDPKKILGPYVSEGMTVLDLGCALGFFSLEAARMVGPDGRVICVDVQQRMIEGLSRRAAKVGLLDRIETRVCRDRDLGIADLNGTVDVALAFAVVHEVPDVTAFIRQIAETLAPQGILFLAEPKGHVSVAEYDKTVLAARNLGLQITERPRVRRSRSSVFRKG